MNRYRFLETNFDKKTRQFFKIFRAFADDAKSSVKF